MPLFLRGSKGRRFALSVNEVESYPPLTIPTRLATIQTLWDALVAFKMPLPAGQAAGAHSPWLGPCGADFQCWCYQVASVNVILCGHRLVRGRPRRESPIARVCGDWSCFVSRELPRVAFLRQAWIILRAVRGCTRKGKVLPGIWDDRGAGCGERVQTNAGGWS